MLQVYNLALWVQIFTINPGHIHGPLQIPRFQQLQCANFLIHICDTFCGSKCMHCWLKICPNVAVIEHVIRHCQDCQWHGVFNSGYQLMVPCNHSWNIGIPKLHVISTDVYKLEVNNYNFSKFPSRNIHILAKDVEQD